MVENQEGNGVVGTPGVLPERAKREKVTYQAGFTINGEPVVDLTIAKVLVRESGEDIEVIEAVDAPNGQWLVTLPARAEDHLLSEGYTDWQATTPEGVAWMISLEVPMAVHPEEDGNRLEPMARLDKRVDTGWNVAYKNVPAENRGVEFWTLTSITGMEFRIRIEYHDDAVTTPDNEEWEMKIGPKTWVKARILLRHALDVGALQLEEGQTATFAEGFIESFIKAGE